MVWGVYFAKSESQARHHVQQQYRQRFIQEQIIKLRNSFVSRIFISCVQTQIYLFQFYGLLV